MKENPTTKMLRMAKEKGLTLEFMGYEQVKVGQHGIRNIGLWAVVAYNHIVQKGRVSEMTKYIAAA